MKTVITVDDSDLVRAIVIRHLERYGCTVLEASNGQEGVDLVRAHNPDLVLMDVNMPVKDGPQALAELRDDPATRSIPVIMLTTESSRDLVVRIGRLGLQGYILKPFQKESFDKEVSRVLGAPSAQAGGTGALALDPHAVLVVDDSEKILALAKAALEQTMTVLTATSGKDAIEQYAKTLPAVVVVDLEMPGMDGFATLVELQKLGRSSCIALAVRGDASLHELARKAGYQAIVQKPFQAAEILEHVTKAANAMASLDDLLRTYMAESGGCSVFDLPGPSPKLLGRLLPLFTKKLRALAEEGTDTLVLDIARLNAISSEHVAMVIRLLSEAATLGIRTAICSPDEQIVNTLRQIAETRDTPYAATRDAARQSLQCGKGTH